MRRMMRTTELQFGLSDGKAVAGPNRMVYLYLCVQVSGCHRRRMMFIGPCIIVMAEE